MNSRNFEESDLPEIASWFASLEWPLPPVADILPNISAVVEHDGKLLACGWLYTTKTTLAILSWTATSPSASQEDQTAAMDLVIKSLQHAAKAGGVKVILVMSKSDAFLTRLKKLGFRSKSGFDLCTWIAKE
jgi:N-acetylglutamate synthase-like GNAT family acetyltransferase